METSHTSNEEEPPQPAGERSPSSDTPAPSSDVAATPRISIPHGTDDDDAPEPPTQTAARHEHMDDAMKNKGCGPESIDDEEAPIVPPSQVDGDDNAEKKPETIDDDAPLPPDHTAGGTLHKEADSSRHINRIIRQGAADRSSSDEEESRMNPRTATLRRLFEFRSTPSRRDNDQVAPNEERDSEIRAVAWRVPDDIEAVEDRYEVAQVAERDEEGSIEPVYDAIPMEMTRWQKYRRYVIGGMCALLIGMAVAVGVSLGANSSADGNELKESVGFVSPTIKPSSVAPSQSLRPTLQPSSPPSSSKVSINGIICCCSR